MRLGLLVFAALFFPRPEADGGRLLASKEPGWPQWRGPRRDGISDEKKLLQSWPAGGPPLLWKTEGLGRGWSSPVVSGGSIYLTGDMGEELRLFALDLNGKVRWESTNGRAWTGQYPGARASCAVDEGRLYHLNAHGRAACFDAAGGKELWSADILQRFEGNVILWGLSECVLVDGPRLIVTPGGKKAAMAALDKKTGETVWTSEPIEKNDAGYGSPILFELGGRRHLVSYSSRHVFGVDADTGRALWKRPRPSEYLALAFTPVFCGEGVYVTTPGKNGGTLYRLGVQDGQPRVETVWDSPVDTLQGGALLVDGLLIGSGYEGFKGWAALDLATGRPRYTTRELAIGSVIYADGRLYCLSERGEMALIQATSSAFEFMGRFPLIAERKQDVWAQPVICDGRLYLRYHETLYCYDIRAK
ncbi:MAG TPA: PQQ-binding-like beta-propeller repeat protein [Planctomycetota bacterium]|nr:PQQ-binding-like beta-propeller repeat protein [Planctomycetota bacterium]